jgi:long-chain acyl-CoA synthetase
MTATLLQAPAQRSRRQGIASVVEIVTDRLAQRTTGVVIRYDDGVDYRDVDHAEYGSNLLRGMALLAGQESQRVVCTFVRNRPEWDLVALSTLYSGNILFPLDTKTPDDELAHLLAISPPDLVLVSRATHARITRVLASLGQHPAIVVADLYDTFEDGGAPEVPDDAVRLSSIRPLDMLPVASERLEDPDLVLGHYATSGTTSLPKVVRITHGNIIAQVNEGMDVMTLRASEDLLNLGPYTHIATLLEFLVTKARGYTVTYVTREPDEDGVLEAEIKKLRRRGVKIRALMAVPKFWVFLLKEVLDEMRGKAIWRSLYTELVDIERHAQLCDLGTLDKAKLNAIRIFLRNRMGGHFTFGISSSSRIDPGVVAIFAKLGVTVIDIYGATEASGIVARNRLNDSRAGSCGRLIAGVEHRIGQPRMVPGQTAPVGVLELRGPTLARGYVGQSPDECLTSDGWYSTGDLARVDSEGWVYLVGREAELVRWGDGSLVDRMHLSNLLVRSIWIKDAMVTRLDDDPFLSVFLYPDRDRMERDRAFRDEVGSGMSRQQAMRSRLVDAIGWAQAVSGISARLETERIFLLSRPLERTPTHKIRFGQELARLDLTRWV